MSDLTVAEADGRIDRTELLSLVTILLLAGHETTAGAIGNAVSNAIGIRMNHAPMSPPRILKAIEGAKKH